MYIKKLGEWVSLLKWGAITGSITDQTDLNTELNGKAPITHTHDATDVDGLDQYITDNAPASTNSGSGSFEKAYFGGI